MAATLSAIVIAACADEPGDLVGVENFSTHGGRPPTTVYDVELLPASDGSARGNAINARGQVAGFADHQDGAVRRATIWHGVVPTDIGTLGGPNSNVPWAGVNSSGMVAGISQTLEKDSLDQRWSCSAFLPPSEANYICHAFVWQHGTMRQLPTLGGANGFATGINARGQVVGWAETAVRDPTCDADTRVLQFRATLWDSRRGTVVELPPLPGDSTSAATAINDRGQIVGISGDCDVGVGAASARSAVIWDRGKVSELPNLGGLNWHTPMAISNRGDVAGFGNVEVSGVRINAFYWSKRTGFRELGALDDDPSSQAHGVNSRGTVVGVSLGGAAGSRAFLWDGKRMFDLNRLAPHFEGVLLDARHITESGVITGSAINPVTKQTVPFIATPKRGRR